MDTVGVCAQRREMERRMARRKRKEAFIISVRSWILLRLLEWSRAGRSSRRDPPQNQYNFGFLQ
jgi:hypothetical protein